MFPDLVSHLAEAAFAGQHIQALIQQNTLQATMIADLRRDLDALRNSKSSGPVRVRGQVTVATVNIRDTPSLTGRRVLQVNKGTIVEGDFEDSWIKLSKDWCAKHGVGSQPAYVMTSDREGFLVEFQLA
jgi:hypothetical protein